MELTVKLFDLAEQNRWRVDRVEDPALDLGALPFRLPAEVLRGNSWVV